MGADDPAAVKYHSLRTFGRNMYALSCFFGSVPWLENANDLPEIIRHLNENMIAAAYMVHTPQQYWEDKQAMLKSMNEEWTDDQLAKEMEKLKDQLVNTIADVMAGRENAGKFFTCVDFIDPNGRAGRWSPSR